MKKIVLLAAITGCTTLAVFGATPRRSTVPARGPLEGTWQYTPSFAPDTLVIRVMNQDHFVQTAYLHRNGTVEFIFGGIYALDGKTYTERVDYADNDSHYSGVLGQQQVFQSVNDENEWHIAGRLTNGRYVNETWRRVQ